MVFALGFSANGRKRHFVLTETRLEMAVLFSPQRSDQEGALAGFIGLPQWSAIGMALDTTGPLAKLLSTQITIRTRE